MANRFPLILNKTTKKLEEISADDDLDLTGCTIIGAVNAEFSGTVECSEILLNGDSVVELINGDWNTLANKPTALSDFTNDVGFITQDTDAQDLGLVGATLSIQRGNSIDLSGLFQLQLNGNNLEIAGGNSVDFSTFGNQQLTWDGPSSSLTISGDNGNTVQITGLESTDTLDDILSRGYETGYPLTVGALNTPEINQTGTGVATISSGSNLVLNAANGFGAIDCSGSALINVKYPADNGDVTIKSYVDAKVNEKWLHFARADFDLNVGNVVAPQAYFTDPDGNIIEVALTVGSEYNHILVTLNCAIDNATDSTTESEFMLRRSINGGIWQDVKAFIQSPGDRYYGGLTHVVCDLHQASPGDTVAYRIANNMNVNYSGENLRMFYGISGDTIGIREVTGS